MAERFKIPFRRKKKGDDPLIDETIQRMRGAWGGNRAQRGQYISYLQEIQGGKRKNPFHSQELLCEVVLELCEYPDSPLGGKPADILKRAAELNKKLLPLGRETRHYEAARRLLLLFLSPEGRDHYQRFDPELYTAFDDKQLYLECMERALSEPVLPYFNQLKGYILANKVHFDTEEAFRDCVFQACQKLELLQWEGGARPLLEELTADNRKRAGIHDIDESTVQMISDQLGSANSAHRRLESATSSAIKAIDTLDQKSQLSVTELESLSKTTLSLMEKSADLALGDTRTRLDTIVQDITHRTSNAVEEFERAYNEYLKLQRDDLNLERDRIVREFLATFREHEARLKAISLEVSDATSSELRRIQKEIHTESEQAMEQLRGFVTQKPSITQQVDALVTPELIERVESISRAVEELGGVDIKQLKEVLSNRQAPEAKPIVAQVPRETIRPINFYLDKSADYRKRFRSLMEKKKEHVEQGELFHELFDEFVALLLEDWNPYVWGPSGCGKTYMIFQAAKLIGSRFFDIGRVNEPYEVIGAGTITGGYTRPPFFQGYVGGGIVFADEIDASSPLATITFNSFTANEFFVFPYYGRGDRHPNFRFVAAGNTRGYGGDSEYLREKIDSSLLQRLTPMEFTYDSRVEQAIFTDAYRDWYEFAMLFRKATDAWSKENHREAPGIFTTRDAARIKDSLDNRSLTEAGVIKYQFIENKELHYLVSLRDKLDLLYNEKTYPSHRLKKLFDAQVEEIEKSSL